MYHYKVKQDESGKYRLYFRAMFRYKLLNDIEYETLQDAVDAYNEHTGGVTSILHFE